MYINKHMVSGVVERRSLTGELSLVCTRPAAAWVTIYIFIYKTATAGQLTRPTQPSILLGGDK